MGSQAGWDGAIPQRWPLTAARRGVDGLAGRMGRASPWRWPLTAARRGVDGLAGRLGRGEPAEMAADGRRTRAGRARRAAGAVRARGDGR